MKLLPLSLLFVCLTTCVLSADESLPEFKRLPHWRQHEKCLPFSYECLEALHAKGIPATQIFYKWQQAGEHGEDSGFHAAVLFQHKGKFWFMDNTRFAPREVTAKTDHGCIMQTQPSKLVFITLVDRWGNKQPTRLLSDRFRKAGI